MGACSEGAALMVEDRGRRGEGQWEVGEVALSLLETGEVGSCVGEGVGPLWAGGYRG